VGFAAWQSGWTPQPIHFGLMLGSGLVHTAYFLLLDRAYRSGGDLSIVYPLARATGPLLTIAFAIAFLGERPGPWALGGAALIGVSAILLAGNPFAWRSHHAKEAVGFALLTGLMIAAYTLLDKRAVAAFLIPPLVFDWGTNAFRCSVLVPFARHRAPGGMEEAWRTRKRTVIAIALLSPLSYILVLTAMGLHAGEPGGPRAGALDPLRGPDGRPLPEGRRRHAPLDRGRRHGARHRGACGGLKPRGVGGRWPSRARRPGGVAAVSWKRRCPLRRPTLQAPVPAPAPTPAWLALAEHRDRLAGTRIDALFDADAGRAAAFTFGFAGLAGGFLPPAPRGRHPRAARGSREGARRARGHRAALHGRAGERDGESPGAAHRGARRRARDGGRPGRAAGRAAVPGADAQLLGRRARRLLARAPRGNGFAPSSRWASAARTLGPRLVTEALADLADGPAVRYCANLDPAALDGALAGLDPATTLVVVASKSFTTLETLTNAAAARRWLEAALGPDALARHMVAATARPQEAERFGLPACNVFPFGDWIGGRYSVWSSVGLPAAIAIGMPAFERLLAGAHAADLAFRSAPPERNAPLIAALAGVWNRNFLGMPAHVVLPYAERLACLPPYLQQLELESNGKRVRTDGTPVDCATAPALFGETGTLGQHAFHQWLHQGTDAVACDFVVVAKPMGSRADAHDALLAHALAQAEALMTGRETGDPHRDCPGDRPQHRDRDAGARSREPGRPRRLLRAQDLRASRDLGASIPSTSSAWNWARPSPAACCPR
jgi:glucose-6-phosphate isomerase